MQRPLDMYSLFQPRDIRLISELNRLMSGKSSSVRKHEIESLRGLAQTLARAGACAEELDGYYFSYTIPKIGKEFDVLRLSDDFVLNIELKYVNVGFTEIAEQQLRNKYYLNALRKEIFICTYICDEGKFYTVNAEQRLTECSPETVMEAVRRTNSVYTGDPDRLFDPEDYIFSPLSDPKRLLEGRYFLTQHQESIEKRLLSLMMDKGSGFASVSGGSGTGKTLLLYDIALKAAKNKTVCVITSDDEFVSIARKSFGTITVINSTEYHSNGFDTRRFDTVFLDDAHLIDKADIERLVSYSRANGVFCLFFTDAPALLNAVTGTKIFWRRLKKLVGAERHQLTDRICTDPETASYVNRLLSCGSAEKNEPKLSYGNNFVLYAATKKEAEVIISRYAQKGYGHYAPESTKKQAPQKGKRIVVMGRSFSYDEEGFLNARNSEKADDIMEKLVFCGFKGIEDSLGILVVGNITLFRKILELFK